MNEDKSHDEWTASEMFAARQATEQAAATLLGQILFEFARLEMALGLHLVWFDSGRQLEKLTNDAVDQAFSGRLRMLERQVVLTEPAGGELTAAYRAWIARADQTRSTRNALVHGRWGVDAHGRHMFNIQGLPTSPEQVTSIYTLEALQSLIDEMKLLQNDLVKLGQHHRLGKRI